MPTAVIVAHPDDETLWCGGRMLAGRSNDWTVLTLCRASDADRSVRFARACEALGAAGVMADLDDGPDQTPLPPATVQRTILDHLPADSFDTIYTHGPLGEYTRHRRHEECCCAAAALWSAGQLRASRLVMFAFEDLGRTILPRVRGDADERDTLPAPVLAEKRRIITEVYGFAVDSWEARATPATEGFYVHTDMEKLHSFMAERTPPQ